MLSVHLHGLSAPENARSCVLSRRDATGDIRGMNGIGESSELLEITYSPLFYHIRAVSANKCIKDGSVSTQVLRLVPIRFGSAPKRLG